MTIEEGGAALVPKKSKFFPISIYAAMQRALTHSSLPAKLRSTAAALAAYADRHVPAKPIRVQQQTLAEVLGRCPKTVGRHLDALAELGWITRAAQGRVGQVGRFRSGRFAGCQFTLTPQAIAALGLAVQQDKMSDGHTGSETTKTTKRQPDGAVDKSTPTPNGVPAELAWLAERGLSKGGICKLMKIANDHDTRTDKNGRRLSDIVAVCRDYLAKIDAPARLYGALRQLAMRNTDWRFAAMQLQSQRVQLQSAKAADDAADAFRRRFGGMALVSPDGSITVDIDRDGRSAVVHKRGKRATMLLHAADQVAILQRQLDEGRLRPATT